MCRLCPPLDDTDWTTSGENNELLALLAYETHTTGFGHLCKTSSELEAQAATRLQSPARGHHDLNAHHTDHTATVFSSRDSKMQIEA